MIKPEDSISLERILSECLWNFNAHPMKNENDYKYGECGEGCMLMFSAVTAVYIVYCSAEEQEGELP